MKDRPAPANHDRLQRKREEAEKSKPHHDELDQALAESFPASDPPSNVSPGTTSNPKHHEKASKDK